MKKRLFDKLAYYTCLGTQYPYEKQTRMLWLIGLAIVFGAPLVGVIPPNIDRLKPLTLPIFLIYMAIVFAMICLGIKRKLFPRRKNTA